MFIMYFIHTFLTNTILSRLRVFQGDITRIQKYGVVSSVVGTP